MEDLVFCYRCGKKASKYIKDNEFWCSWCGQSFNPNEKESYLKKQEEEKQKREEEDKKRKKYFEEHDRRIRLSKCFINGEEIKFCDILWIEKNNGRKVRALDDLNYDITNWSNSMNWHEGRRPDNVFIPKGTIGKICSVNIVLKLIAVKWIFNILKNVILWYDEEGFTGNVGLIYKVNEYLKCKRND